MIQKLPCLSLPHDAHLRKLRRRYLLTFLILGLVSILYSYGWHQTYRRENQVIWVVVTQHDVEAPTLLTDKDITLRPFPRKFLPRQFFLETGSLLGKLVDRPLIKGQVLLPHHLGPEVDPGSISAKFEKQYAFTLDEEWLIARLPQVKPHDRIDILTTNPKGGIDESVPLAQNIEIIQIQTLKSGKKTLVLNLTEDQAQSLIFARGLRLPMQVLVHSSLQKTPSPK